MLDYVKHYRKQIEIDEEIMRFQDNLIDKYKSKNITLRIKLKKAQKEIDKWRSKYNSLKSDIRKMKDFILLP